MSAIDVVVPCYRYARYLRECVLSVLTQRAVAVRVLVIDDASPDETPEVAARLAAADPRVTVRRHACNRGHIATYNEGIEWASARYFLLLSADDYLLPGALERACGLMERCPDVAFTFGGALELADDGTTTGMPSALPERSPGEPRVLGCLEFVELGGARNIVPTPTAVVRTAAQHAVGGYRAELPHAGDMEMWLRLAAHGAVGFIPQPQAVYRRHASNMSHAWFRDRWLPDLQQRRLAIESFLAGDGTSGDGAGTVRDTLLRSLAIEAVGWASAAFNDDDRPLCDALRAFALDTAPEVRGSSAWRRLDLKRRLGVRRWRAIAPALGGVRRLLGASHG